VPYDLSVCVLDACFVIKTAKHFVEILLPRVSPITLVFRHRGSLLRSDGFTVDVAYFQFTYVKTHCILSNTVTDYPKLHNQEPQELK